ncbi:hypothetical protein ACFVWN_31325 [Nocardiopsis flavescens]|uniref:Uncharacterized protein n=1 Tax=Nocardiopsis flavescens TaxID=758803 RepID=A0A1M6QY62_9ACTN|nr:hypothetical protein [Nocardiopsis flavescens]SHK25096.1 hypothetical protein SAMN05421803_11675 [Nocardiopsis flavescens]
MNPLTPPASLVGSGALTETDGGSVRLGSAPVTATPLAVTAGLAAGVALGYALANSTHPTLPHA